jgi:hypothetical protein
MVDPATDTCIKTKDLPALPPGLLCPPERQTASGTCCVPPMIPAGTICSFPDMPKPQTPVPQTPTPGPQLGTLWTDSIHFQQDHPAPGEANAAQILTPAGQSELASAQKTLALSPDLQARLVGHASSEGDAGYNQALATRRVLFIGGKLAGRTADPLVPDAETAGCAPAGTGMWSCGEGKADQTSANPEDRVVRVTFTRNKLPALTSPSLAPGP